MKNIPDNTENIDRNIEKILGNLLRTGVIIAGVIVLVGAVLFLIRHGKQFPGYHIFKADPFVFSDFRNLFKGVVALKSVPVIELGILF